jgi:hypothetical protein
VDLDDTFEPSEVLLIPSEQWKPFGARGCGDEKIHGSRSTCGATGSDNRRVDPSVGACGVSVERQRIKRGLDPLEPILTSRPLLGIIRGVRARGELRQRERTDGELCGEVLRIDHLKVDDDRSVDDAPRQAAWISHEARGSGSPRRRDRGAAEPGPLSVRP